MKRKTIGLIILAAVLFSGCASTSGPTSKVGIVNGKYAVKTTVPNNNKGKKVDFKPGQSYACVMINPNRPSKTVDLEFNKDKTIVIHAEGKVKFVYNGKDMGWRNDDFLVKFSPNNQGKMALFNESQKKAVVFQCTQTTNNSYTKTRYLTDDEISAYQHNQQIAVQQRAINNANYNATMARIQAQNAQTNYNTQQALNRMNASSQSTINSSSNNKFYMHSDGTSTRKVGNTYYHSNGTTTTSY